MKHISLGSLKRRSEKLPEWGWLFPEHGFVAAEDHPKVALYGAIGTSLEGTKSGQTSDEDRSFLRNRYGEACRVGEMESLFVYDIQGPTEAGRIMFTAKRLPGEMRSGMITVPMAVSDIAAVNKLLGWGDSGVLRRDEAIAVRRQSFWYSFHRLYDSKTGKLIQEASVLHDKDGKLLAREQFADLSDGMCDSCSVSSLCRWDELRLPIDEHVRASRLSISSSTLRLQHSGRPSHFFPHIHAKWKGGGTAGL
jgi:hypothetical protein